MKGPGGGGKYAVLLVNIVVVIKELIFKFGQGKATKVLSNLHTPS